ncbi:hypothetical protein EUBHAL_02838 [Anaerobutyricum hallii DSM 3353]|uniref:Uncharacterized protein n=1 Tax=Anaerobutyricum hallii DSM 3353 TaxID=411469 RepID=C0EZH7_9FIRM|nr:hypothetical protein EUBHAL_02838 [Anaerobutyricum hallii DSM 3353]
MLTYYIIKLEKINLFVINNCIQIKKGAKRQLTKILKISQVVFRAFFLALIDKIFVLLEHFSNTL